VQSVPQSKHRQFIWDFKLTLEQNVQAILDENSFIEDLDQSDFEVYCLLPDIKASGGQTRVNMRELLACFLELTIKSARKLYIAKTTYIKECFPAILGNKTNGA
jgi:sulfur transfer complex TusBCD TusB component (DsrH family)